MTRHQTFQRILSVFSLLGTLILGASCRSLTPAPDPEMLGLKGDLNVHDPAIIRQGDAFYVFCTGGSPRRGGFIPIRCSRNLYTWHGCGAVFDALPGWTTQAVLGTHGIWAPDISYFNGRYRL